MVTSFRRRGFGLNRVMTPIRRDWLRCREWLTWFPKAFALRHLVLPQRSSQPGSAQRQPHMRPKPCCTSPLVFYECGALQIKTLLRADRTAANSAAARSSVRLKLINGRTLTLCRRAPSALLSVRRW